VINSIKYFEENGIKNIEELEKIFYKNPTDLASYVMGITEELHKLGLMIIRESLMQMNQFLCDSPMRKKQWVVEKHSTKQLLTSLGRVEYTRTLFTNKETKEETYLLDQIMGLGEHERITEDALARLYEETVQSSYRRGGEELSLTEEVSKETVKNKLHELQFPQEERKQEKKVAEYLYVDADEDHISLQFREKRGDIQKENGRKNNGQIVKLAYVYEGIEKDAPKSQRRHLVNPHYFCGTNYEESNEVFWKRVWTYLEETYDLEQVRKIYLNSDGGAWICAGGKYLEKVVRVLDEFHLEKYITKMTSHMKDSQGDAKSEIREAVKNGDKTEFKRIVERLKNVSGEDGLKRIEMSAEYILSNWGEATIRLGREDGVKGCSAEGHVSHVLSSRMSSRPMGWSPLGASKMARLREYYLNDGKMIELAKYQKKEVKKAAGAEEVILSCKQVMASERNDHKEVGKYLETIHHSVSQEAKKYAWFNGHIWGL
jgi:hypothetical protein